MSNPEESAHNEVVPPWIKFPKQEPWWGGWRQGTGEEWLKSIWFPFWKNTSEAERNAYVNRWKASSEWREYLLVHWSPKSSIDKKQI